jgi:hypothetical protein
MSTTYNQANAALCESLYIDTLFEPENTVIYAYDCSAGCRPCAYLQGDNGMYRCKNQLCRLLYV